MEVSPAGILTMWSAGLSAGLAVVAARRIVRRGYVWLAAGTTALFGLFAAVAGSSWWAYAACAFVVTAALLAGHTPSVLACGALGMVAFTIASVEAGSPVALAVTGAVALGAITTEMMLGHWYLVDPRLPRSVLRVLALAGVAGIGADMIFSAAAGAASWGDTQMVLGWGWLALGVTSALLMVMVYAALGERGYAGVMAATGLSYLAVLTSTGAVVLGRLLA
ncbi:MAG TPA: hypothetical protein VMM81_07090 [Acidimicrobiia bacterium]|nr:hypothetical protein [Acidimicrobiia bacterium]